MTASPSAPPPVPTAAAAPSSSAASLVDRLRAIVGPANVLTAQADVAPYLVEWRGLYHGRTRAVVRPGSTAEVAAVMKLATETGTAVVPQGGNTGLVGGQIPFDGEIVLSLQRMNRVREVDPLSDTMTLEAGVTLAAAHAAAEREDRMFPLSLASEGTCTIGGNLSTNAGGTAVLAYGNARDLVLGIEVVLADGRVLNSLGKLRKDNTGYDLKQLFIGSEGTLGIITAAVLKLYPPVRATTTAFVGLASPIAALALLARAKAEAGAALTTFELMPRFGVELVLRHLPGARDPLESVHRWYVLIELTSPKEDSLEPLAEAILGAALEAGEAEDAAIAASLDQRTDFWRLREAMSEVQGKEGGSIKHDVSVPLAAIPAVLAEGIAAAEALIPGIRPVPFGHLGDGNIHFNFSQPVGADKQAYLDRWDELNRAVHAVVLAHGGSISAEHGIGRLKKHLLAEVKDPVALALMRDIKRSLDPRGILNPSKILDVFVNDREL
jgi:FAD/FMN-containing dehydrogenase